MKKEPGTKWIVNDGEAEVRLDKWLAAADRLGSRSRAVTAIERGKIFIDEVEQTSADSARMMKAGETVRYWVDRPGSAQKRYFNRHDSGLHLIYEDRSLLVINKPAGLLTVHLSTQPDEPSLDDLVKDHLRSDRHSKSMVVHRIDRDTSGLVIFAKNPAAQKKLKEQFAGREASRVYLSVVNGHPAPERGSWRDMLSWDTEELKQQRGDKRDRNTREAVSQYKTLEKFNTAALIEVRLVTGRQNQIRVQASLRGHDLVGEKIYLGEGGHKRAIEFPRQALHAFRLTIVHPVDNRKLNFEAPLPDDLRSLIDRLRRG